MFLNLYENWRLYLIAQQFLSRLPITLTQAPTEKEIAHSVRYFPLVGLLLGLILLVTDLLLGNVLPLMGVNVILIVVMMVYTGGLHLDGFADTLDAWYSGKDKDKMLAIMKDSHLGVIGGTGIILLFALLLTFLHVIPAAVRSTTLLLMPMVSRTAVVNLVFLGIYPRESGTGKIFIEGAQAIDWLIAQLITVGFCIYFFQMKGVVLFLLSYAFSLSILRGSVRRIEGVTGDVLGFCNEVISLAVLIIIKFLFLNN